MTKPQTVREILAKTEAYLRDKAVDSPRLSAQLLLAKGLDMDRIGLFVNLDRPLKETELAALRPLVARRGKGEPMAYILGEREFFGLAFSVCGDVLIPRPETEQLIEEAQRLFDKETPLAFADLGTGSGCLAVTLAALFPLVTVTALDSSPAALAVASANAAKHGVEDRITFVLGDFSALPPSRTPANAGEQCGYDLIVSNPPYVSHAEFGELSPEVACFEPRCALVPDAPEASGLEAYPAVVAVALRRLNPRGVLAMEIGWKQGPALKDLLESQEFGFEGVTVLKDLAGHDRIVIGRKPG